MFVIVEEELVFINMICGNLSKGTIIVLLVILLLITGTQLSVMISFTFGLYIAVIPFSCSLISVMIMW